MASEPGLYFSAVWVYDDSAGTYTNNTIEAQTSGGTSFSLLFDTSDYVYLGSQSKFDMAFFDIDTAAVIGALTWEYHNGTAWTQFVPRFQNLPGNETFTPYGFTEDGAEIFPVTSMTSWTSADLDSIDGQAASMPDTTARYYVRVSAASLTTAPTVKQIQKRDYNAYCTPEDIYEFFQLGFTGGAFTSSTTPTLASVENIIHRQQAIVDRRTRRSWRPSIAIEHHPFNLGGITMVKKNVQRVLKLELWNGRSWEAKVQGRDEEFFFIPNIDGTNFSRLFLLPARFTGTNRGYYGFGIGEFDFGIRITHIYGLDRSVDEEAGAVIEDACIKLVAADLLKNADRTKLLITGTQHISPSERAQQLTAEANEALEELRRVEIF